MRAPRLGEFFAGIGLVRLALEGVGFRAVFANDIDTVKCRLYSRNFGAAGLRPGDIRLIRSDDVPDLELATATFPCTDLSLAGSRAGLNGKHSGLFWEFVRVLKGMKARRPPLVMLENVPGLVTSNDGADLRAIITALNDSGYICDLLVLDAKHFVPQSRPRLFIIGNQTPFGGESQWSAGPLRSSGIIEFVHANSDLKLQALTLPDPPNSGGRLADLVERVPPQNELWWDVRRLGKFLSSLSSLQAERLEYLRRLDKLTWLTAYRRTRNGVPMWEVRQDEIGGCLRTTRGGSSRQAVVEVGRGNVRVRWMTAAEYARLQGAADYKIDDATESQARFAFGDAVCVPAVAWLGKHYLYPLARAMQSKAVVNA